MARGIPVVSTSIGVAGLDLRNREHLLIADTPEDFAQAVLRLLTSPGERARLARSAQAQVSALYDWRRCCLPLLASYQQLADLARPTASHQGLHHPISAPGAANQ
jgi:glycosyltransferase involved in cell wall biosynthesis